MKMKKAGRILTAVLAVILVCTAGLGIYAVKNYGANFGIYLGKPSVEQYMEQAIGFMEQGMYTEGEQWQKMKEYLRTEAKTKNSYEECYDLIDEGLRCAGGKHSRMLRTEQKDTEKKNTIVKKTSDEVLTIEIPEFMDGTKEEIDFYVQIAHSWLRENEGCRGVIIDLRGNTGGDAGVMLAACAPLLPDGTVISFDVSGYRQDAVLSDSQVTGAGSTVSFEPYKMTDVPVAILQDEMTASSGEVTLLAFRGLEYARTFGAPSAGYCSCNTVRKLYDGARMMITIGQDVARTGEYFCEDPIEPDVYSEDPWKAAEEWIMSY